MLRAAAVAAVVFASFFGVMFLRFSGDTVPASDPTPSPAAVATVSVSPTPLVGAVPGILDGVEVIPLELGPEIELPRDVALIVETGCTGCDGPTEGFVRIYRDATGDVRVDSLVTLEKLGFDYPGPEFTGFAIDSDGAEIAVSVCVRDTCGTGSLEPWSADSAIALFRSADSGVTWTTAGEVEAGGQVIGILSDRGLLVATYEEPPAPTSFRIFPSLDLVKPPEDATWPVVLPDGEIAWQTGTGKLLLASGAVFLDLGHDQGPDSSAWIGQPFPAIDSPNWLVDASVSQHEGQQFQQYFLEIEPDGGTPIRAFSLPAPWFSGAAVARDVLFTDCCAGEAVPNPNPYFITGFPTFVDLSSGELRPLRQLASVPGFPTGRNHVVAASRGPFARVVNTDGTCLYIREAPGSAGEALDCAAEGVLLHDRNGLRFFERGRWMLVQTPSGIEGWASAEYLER